MLRHPLGLATAAVRGDELPTTVAGRPDRRLATPDSDESCRPGGLAEQTLELAVFDEYETPCDHGFFNRGDLSDPAVAACVETALEHLKHFLIGNM